MTGYQNGGPIKRLQPCNQPYRVSRGIRESLYGVKVRSGGASALNSAKQRCSLRIGDTQVKTPLNSVIAGKERPDRDDSKHAGRKFGSPPVKTKKLILRNCSAHDSAHRGTVTHYFGFLA